MQSAKEGVRTRAFSLSHSQVEGASGLRVERKGFFSLTLSLPSLGKSNRWWGLRSGGPLCGGPGRVGGPSVCLGEDGCLHYHVNPGKLPPRLGGGWAWATGLGGWVFSGLDHTAAGKGVCVES